MILHNACPAVLLFAVVSLDLVVRVSSFGSPLPILTEYPVSGSPLRVSVESPSRIWFTLPAENSIGLLEVDPEGQSQITYYPVTTPLSEPYDLEYTGGLVWFSERAGNKIGCLNAATGVISEFEIQTPNSQPTGIDVVPGDPVAIWFAEREGNQLARLEVTTPLEFAFVEFPLPAQYVDAYPEDVFFDSGMGVWFTAPGVSKFGIFWWPPRDPGAPAFSMVHSGTGSQPWALKMDGNRRPWFTERAGGRIGQFVPGTFTDIVWYLLPLAQGGPYDLAVVDEQVLFTEMDGDRLGLLRPHSRTVYELSLPGSAPAGLSVDVLGCAWIAESGGSKIARWCPPYLHWTHLPLVIRSQ